MSFFTPVLFSIATIHFDETEATLTDIQSGLEEVSVSNTSGYAFDFNAIAFANKHPGANQILLEVQALTEDDRVKAIDIVTGAVASATTEVPFWNDVTEAALAYHADLKAKESTATSEVIELEF